MVLVTTGKEDAITLKDCLTYGAILTVILLFKFIYDAINRRIKKLLRRDHQDPSKIIVAI